MKTNGFGRQLKKWRRMNNRMNQSVFAKKLGVSIRTVASWESGELIPSSKKISFIADILSVDEEWLLYDTTADEKSQGDSINEADGLYFDAKGLAEECGQISDLVDTLKLFNVKYSFLVSVKNKAKTVGAQNFFIKLNDIFIDSGVGIQEVMTELIGFIVGKSIEVGPTMRDTLVSSIAECRIFDKVDTKKREVFICWVDSEISDIEAFDLLTIFTTKWNIDHE